MAKPRHLSVFADLWCPFAYVGLVAASVHCADTERGVQLTIRSWPLELVNGTPLAEEKTYVNATALRTSVAPELFSGIDHWSYPTSTLAALSLAAKASTVDLELGRAVSMHLRHRLFEDGADLSCDEELTAVAEKFGVKRDARDLDLVRRDYDDGIALGVNGSPHFFCDTGADLFCPTLDLKRDESGTLQVTMMMGRLERFIATCAAA